MLAYCQPSEISLGTLQIDPPIEGSPPPMKNQLRKWVSQPSTAAPCNSTQPPTNNELKLKTQAWHQCQMCGMIDQVSPKSYSKGREGIPKQEYLSAKQHQQS